MQQYLRRIWAEINLRDITRNCTNLRALIGDTCRIMAVVKADAYGHGAKAVSEALSGDADCFGVATVAEGIELRKSGVDKPILIMGRTPPEEMHSLIDYALTQTTFSSGMAALLSAAAVSAGRKISIHIKADTGMNRLGFRCAAEAGIPAAAAEILQAACLPGLDTDGIYTHFADADDPAGRGFTEKQFSLFNTLIDTLKASGLEFPLRHCANSAAAIMYPEARMDMIRPGIAMYGHYPDNNADSPMRSAITLAPAMELHSVISAVHRAETGDTVSYGRTFRTSSPRWLAVISAGYADGYPRSLSGISHVLVNGFRAPVVGRVCMDMLMADITEAGEAAEGDEVVLFGRQGNACIPIEELAEKAGTVNYELLCALSKRVPRVYIR